MKKRIMKLGLGRKKDIYEVPLPYNMIRIFVNHWKVLLFLN